MVRLYRTFSIYIFTGETRFAGCLCTSSGWFKCIEPPRTFSNHIIAEIARCVEFFHMSSGWFDCAEPSLSTFLQGKQDAYALVRGGSRESNLLEPSPSSNLLEPHHRRDCKVCRVLPHEFGVVRLCRTFSIYIFAGFAGCFCTSSGWFKRIEPPRTFSNHIIAEIARCVEFFHMSSGWFDCSLSTFLQGKQGLQGAYALVRGGSRASNLLEPSRTTSRQR